MTDTSNPAQIFQGSLFAHFAVSPRDTWATRRGDESFLGESYRGHGFICPIGKVSFFGTNLTFVTVRGRYEWQAELSNRPPVGC
jgi:hypothetical protein